MNRDPDFSNDWISPGEYLHCRSCGNRLLPQSEMICAHCRHKPRLDDLACGICGGAASMMWIHGARCYQHAWQIDPSSKFGDASVIGTACKGLMMTNTEADIADCDNVHNKLYAERNALAESRRSAGLPPLFWMKGLSA